MSKKLNFGPMDEKCFISRSELLQWINNLLQVPLTKVEQLGSGNIYCQLFDVIYPGKIPMNKLKWKAKHEYEFTHNFKLLQKGFDAVQVAKSIPIEKLVKVKYQDNLEFAQWMKRFFELNCRDKGKGYEAKKRRGFQEPDLSFCGGGVLPQYTMIYGNFKDMEREIAKNNEEEEEEEYEDLQKSQSAINSQGTKEKVMSQNSDKENVNTINIIKNKQEPPLQKFQKTNSSEQKVTQGVGLKNESDIKQQLQQQQRVSPFNPVVAPSLIKQSQNSLLQNQDSASLFTSQSTFNNSNMNNSNSDCPFFMNNNQVNKYPTLNFQNNCNNLNLLKQLENKNEIAINKTPSMQDKIFKDSDSIMNSGASSSTSSLTDSKNNQRSRFENNDTIKKLDQIKELFSISQIDCYTDKDNLLSILNQIKSIIH